MQIWVAADTEHRVDTTKLKRILQLAADVIPRDDVELEVEYEFEVNSQYPVVSGVARNGAVVFKLGTHHTDCLAKETCGVPKPAGAEASCCAGSGCCTERASYVAGGCTALVCGWHQFV